MREWQPDETIGDRLRVGRARKRLTLRQTATAIGRSASYLSDVENGRRIPSEDVLISLGDLLDLDIEDLMASAARLGEDVNDYLRRTPEAGILFRRLSQRDIAPEELRKLIDQVPNLASRESIETDRER